MERERYICTYTDSAVLLSPSLKAAFAIDISSLWFPDMLSGQDAFGAGVDQQHLRTPQGLVGRGLEAALPRDLPDHAGRSLWRGLGTLGISYFCRLGVLF